MPSLKEFRVRIASVKSMQRITAAMKMVAAAKLRRAQEQAEAARPYAERMERMLSSLAGSVGTTQGAPPLLGGSGRDDIHLLVVVTTDRGLCGGLNGTAARATRQRIRDLTAAGKTVKLLCVGRKGAAALRRDHREKIVATLEDMSRPVPTFAAANDIAAQIAMMLQDGGFDVCTVIYSRFLSALSQRVTLQQLIPFAGPEGAAGAAAAVEDVVAATTDAVYEYEPSEEQILDDLLPRNLSVQIYRALLENFASEQGARMTAMDSATRNAGDLIDRLTLNYNRTRQAHITRELIEIISGAEAL